MNAQDKAEARAAIERAGELAKDSNHFTTNMSQLQIIYNYKRVVPELAAHLRAALAENAVLEQQLENFRKAFKEMDYISNFPSE